MQNDNLYKKLRFFALCLAIICMILSLIKRAKAKEMEQYYQDYINQYLDDYYSGNIDLTSIYNECPYFTILQNNGYDYAMIYFTSNENVSFKIARYQDEYIRTYSYLTSYNWGGMYYGFVSTEQYNQTETNNIVGYVLQLKLKTGSYDLCKPVPTNSMTNTTGSNPNLYYCRTDINIINRDANLWDFDFDESITISNYDCYMFAGNDGHVYSVEKNIESIKNNTDGFVVYKQSIHNHDFLMIDFSKCINWSYASNSDYYLGDSSFDIYIDGNKETIELDDNTYYTYNSSSQKAYFQIPVTFFNAYGYENATNVYINNVNINYGIVVGMPMNFDAHYVNDVYLKKANDINFQPDNTQLENEITYQDNITLVENINNELKNDGNYSLTFDADNIYSDYLAAKASVSGEYKGLQFTVWYENTSNTYVHEKAFYYPISTYSDDRIYLAEDILNNGYALYYDVLFVDVYLQTYDSSRPLSETTTYKGCMVIYSQKYYIRNANIGILTSLKDITEYDKITSQYIYWFYDLANDKLRNMDNNMSVYFNSSLDVINNILESLDNINNSLTNLDDILNKILDALKNLNISQLDSIDTKLSTIIDNMSNDSSSSFNEDDTISEAIAYYQSHTQVQAVLEDKYSVWFTGYCHFWLQEYGEEEPVRNIKSASVNVSDYASSEKRHILFRTFKVVTNIYDKMQEDLLFNRVEEMFDYFLNSSNEVSHSRKSFFYDIFDDELTPTLDYNPYE